MASFVNSQDKVRLVSNLEIHEGEASEEPSLHESTAKSNALSNAQRHTEHSA